RRRSIWDAPSPTSHDRRAPSAKTRPAEPSDVAAALEPHGHGGGGRDVEHHERPRGEVVEQTRVRRSEGALDPGERGPPLGRGNERRGKRFEDERPTEE